MQTTTGIQTTRTAPRVPFITVVAVALAVLFGAALGSAITGAMTARPAEPVTTTWDAQKLLSMQGRQAFVATRAPAIPWDEQKLDAMAGRQLAG
jgi:hypothetical protein